MKKLPALICALVVVAAACGGSEGTETTAAPTTEPPTTTTAAPSTTAAETTTTIESVEELDYGDPANWPLTAPELELPVTFVDGIGNEVTVTKADRIGSLYGTATEILWDLGLGDRLVVIDSTSQYPAELADIPNVGFFQVLPAEGIIAEAPDVLFVSPAAGPPETLEAVEAAGTVIVRIPDMTEEIESFEEIVDMLGVATGMPDHAAAFADAVCEGVAEAMAEPAEEAPVVAYAVARGQYVQLTGLDSPSNSIIAAAGYRSLAGELDLEEWVPLTPEAVVSVNPDVILTTRSSAAQAGGAEAFLAMPGFAESTAGQNGAIIVWEDDAGIQLWTPRSAAAILRLRELLEELTG
jgi:iron complex transport system substrate-binding protein